MSARPAKKKKVESKSFTTRISMETWRQVENYKRYGNWNNNQLMNHALNSFLDLARRDRRRFK